MSHIALEKWDAFSDGRSPGNPVAVVRLHTPAVDAVPMMRLAGELQGWANGVVTVAQGEDGFSLRFFLTGGEAPLAGHGMLAAAHSLLAADPSLAGGSMVLQAGGRLLALAEAPGRVFVQSKAAAPLPLPPFLDDLYWALGLSEAQMGREELRFVDVGQRVLLVPMRTSAALADLLPVWETLGNYCDRYRVDVMLPWTANATMPASRWRARAFAPRLGLREDPASGLGNAALGYELLRLGLWQGEPAQVEQGSSYERPNLVQLQARDGRVWFGGPARLCFSGVYHL